jgi:hypothetical protein
MKFVLGGGRLRRRNARAPSDEIESPLHHHAHAEATPPPRAARPPFSVASASPPLHAPGMRGSVARGSKEGADGRTPPAMTPEKWFDTTGAHSKRNVPPLGAAQVPSIGIGPSVNDLLSAPACGQGNRMWAGHILLPLPACREWRSGGISAKIDRSGRVERPLHRNCAASPQIPTSHSPVEAAVNALTAIGKR